MPISKEFILGDFSDDTSKKKIRKVKMKCGKCGHIDYTLRCTECDSAMYPYKNVIGKF